MGHEGVSITLILTKVKRMLQNQLMPLPSSMVATDEYQYAKCRKISTTTLLKSLHTVWFKKSDVSISSIRPEPTTEVLFQISERE